MTLNSFGILSLFPRQSSWCEWKAQTCTHSKVVTISEFSSSIHFQYNKKLYSVNTNLGLKICFYFIAWVRSNADIGFKRVVEKVLILLTHTHTHTNKLWVLFFKCVPLHFVLILSLEILLTWNFTSLEKTFWEVHLFALLQRVSLASRL